MPRYINDETIAIAQVQKQVFNVYMLQVMKSITPSRTPVTDCNRHLKSCGTHDYNYQILLKIQLRAYYCLNNKLKTSGMNVRRWYKHLYQSSLRVHHQAGWSQTIHCQYMTSALFIHFLTLLGIWLRTIIPATKM